MALDGTGAVDSVGGAGRVVATDRVLRADRVVQADGRSKAYRPLPVEARTAAVLEGLAAYERGEPFEAHEAWEPAWMGTSDIAERALLQGLIKLAAADVHGERGNPRGVARNLAGALERLRTAADAGVTSAPGIAIEVGALIVAAEARLGRAALGETTETIAIPWRPA